MIRLLSSEIVINCQARGNNIGVRNMDKEPGKSILKAPKISFEKQKPPDLVPFILTDDLGDDQVLLFTYYIWSVIIN